MRKIEITLPNIPPSKKNNKMIVARGNRPFIISSKEYRRWESDMSWYLVPHRDKLYKVEKIEVRFFPRDNHRFDLGNKAEGIFDLFVLNKVIEDDSWKYLPEIYLVVGEVDKDDPRTEVTLYIDDTIV